MNLIFNSATVNMMSQTLTAIISKFVTQKRLTVNQTAVIAVYFLSLFSDGVECYKGNTVSVVCE
jgi:hypothetical protein